MSEEPPAEPLPLLEIRHGLPDVTESRAGLDRIVEQFAAGSGPVAIDAERASGYRYSQRAYLVQLARHGAGTALVDPVGFGDVPNESLEPLADAIGSAEWIIHAASQDLLCLAELGMRPRTLFDTELAGRLLNLPRVGLATLVEEFLGVRLRKEHSAVDWSRRPMPASWLEYAALDVEPLVELRDILAGMLEDAGKSEWARQEFAYWTTLPFRGPRIEPWRRTSGIHRIRGRRGLAVVREIWQLRDDRARESDTAQGRHLPDAGIIEMAAALPRSIREIERLPAFRRPRPKHFVRELSAALERARALPDRDLPPLAAPTDGPPHPRAWAHKYPEAAARLGQCREAVTAVATKQDVPAENLISPDAIRRLAWAPPAPVTTETVAAQLAANGARPWQIELVAKPLAEAVGTPTA
jgi:ribonuclease D